MEYLHAIMVDTGTAITVMLILGLFHGIRRIIGGVTKITTHLDTLNGSVAQIKKQQYEHEQHDDLRHAQNVDRLAVTSQLTHELYGKVEQITKLLHTQGGTS